VGCGAGQTLIVAYPECFSVGVDIDREALRLGRSLTDRIGFVCARAESLPLRDGQFDMVISRVALPYTDISASLREFRRVLSAGGQVWMTLHTLALPWNQARHGNYKSWILFGYVILNSALFHVTQKQFPLRGKYETFQTRRGITRSLEKAGFEKIAVAKGRHFLVTACVPAAAAPVTRALRNPAGEQGSSEIEYRT
jgi:ubiquinone/menaquinone biosynthesis C-methylase UbiE